MRRFINRSDVTVFLLLVGVFVVAMLQASCAGDSFWSDDTAQTVQERAELEVSKTQETIDSEAATVEEKRLAIDRNAVAKAKLELLAELRSEAHSQDGAIDATTQTLETVGALVPGYGPALVAGGGILTAIWQAFARRRAAKALSQLSKGINVGKQNSPELANALAGTKAIIGYYLDDDSRRIIDETRNDPKNNPAVSFPAAAAT